VFEGFPDKVNNLGWVVRLSVDRQGVRAWQAHDVHIDKQGLPHAGKQPKRVETLR
jgi:poly-gamma-glutamate synthesis protein (capsule biosynthesis protein)